MVSAIFASCAKCGGIDFKDEMIMTFDNYYDDECYFEVTNGK
jgi:hypothetical protein